MKTKDKRMKLVEKIKSLSGFISAMVVIGGALIGAGQWIVHQINASTNSRMDSIEQKIDGNQQSNELSITRLELMTLIQTDPDNVIEIEKLAKKYFNPPLNGNAYMTSVISKWCEAHSVDCGSIILK